MCCSIIEKHPMYQSRLYVTCLLLRQIAHNKNKSKHILSANTLNKVLKPHRLPLYMAGSVRQTENESSYTQTLTLTQQRETDTLPVLLELTPKWVRRYGCTGSETNTHKNKAPQIREPAPVIHLKESACLWTNTGNGICDLNIASSRACVVHRMSRRSPVWFRHALFLSSLYQLITA